MKKVLFMDTSFRDGFQSCFGARVLTPDFLPCIKASVDAGITYFEAGGGARFQSLFFYCNESAFDMMDSFRKEAGPDANLQTLSRGINAVALSQQPKDIVDLHAKLFKKHGITTIRNFDALNDMENLQYSGERITAHGLKHQVTVTLMDLPPGCEGAHSVDFYTAKTREILDLGIPFDSIAFKDASGTANPNKVYETIKAARKMLPEDTVIWFHTHDTAGAGLSQNMAAIQGGATGIDLSKSPCSGGTCQPDILSMWHIMKGSGYTLDIDYEKILKAEEVFEEAMKDYYMPPEALKTSPVIPLSPMPGGALTANTMMMRDTGTLHLYPKVITEMSNVVKKGGFGTSVTPVSQFYFQQAYANVTQGQWKKITKGYGEMVLGYFGKTPVEPDPEVVAIAAEQLGRPPFKGNPIEALDPGIPAATKILEENNLPVNDENIFIIASCESKGLDFLKGNARVNVRKISEQEQASAPASSAAPVAQDSPQTYTVTLENKSYVVQVQSGAHGGATQVTPVESTAAQPQPAGELVKAPAPGLLLKLQVAEGENVVKGQVLIVLEAMKMETEIVSPRDGQVSQILAKSGDSVQTGDNLLLLA